MKKPLNKKELLKIINDGWKERREASVKRRILNSIRAADWKNREKNKTAGLNTEKRQKHYIKNILPNH